MALVERAAQLALLAEQLDGASDAGRLVLITGEPGAGKSALVEEFRRQHLAGATVLLGRCDDLFAPRPLGPVADIARDRPGALAAALTNGDQPAVFDAFLDELTGTRGP